MQRPQVHLFLQIQPTSSAEGRFGRLMLASMGPILSRAGAPSPDAPPLPLLLPLFTLVLYANNSSCVHSVILRINCSSNTNSGHIWCAKWQIRSHKVGAYDLTWCITSNDIWYPLIAIHIGVQILLWAKMPLECTIDQGGSAYRTLPPQTKAADQVAQSWCVWFNLIYQKYIHIAPSNDYSYWYTNTPSSCNAARM